MLTTCVNLDAKMSEEMLAALSFYAGVQAAKGIYTVDKKEITDYLLDKYGEKAATEFTEDMLYPEL